MSQAAASSSSSASFLRFELLFSGSPPLAKLWQGLSICIFESTPLSYHQPEPSSQSAGCLKAFHPLSKADLLAHIDAWNITQESPDAALTVHQIAGVRETETSWIRHIVNSARTRSTKESPNTIYHRWTHARLSNQLHIDMVESTPTALPPRRRTPKRPQSIAPSQSAASHHPKPKKTTPQRCRKSLDQAAKILLSMRKTAAPSPHHSYAADEMQRMARIIELQSELIRLHQYRPMPAAGAPII